MNDNLLHVLYFLSGSTALGLLAHAVNTFPTPSNKYGQWLLGVIQFAVGQRTQAKQTLVGGENASTSTEKK